MILPLSFREAFIRSTAQFPQSKQRLPKLCFLQKLGCQKPCWDQARLCLALAIGLVCGDMENALDCCVVGNISANSWRLHAPTLLLLVLPRKSNMLPDLSASAWRAKQEPGKRFHSSNWGTLGHPPQNEEHYFTVHCTLYIGHSTLCTVQCPLYSVQCTLYTVRCTLYTVHGTLYSVHCTLFTVHCTLYTVHCTLYTLHCTPPLICYCSPTVSCPAHFHVSWARKPHNLPS